MTSESLKETHPIYNIYSTDLLHKLYDLVSSQNMNDLDESIVLDYNILQLNNFFGNLLRIKNLNKCKLSLRGFIQTIQKKNNLETEKDEEICQINAISHANNNLIENLYKSVEPVHFRYILPNYLSTKKKNFNSKTELRGKFHIGNEVFNQIKLSTVKNKSLISNIKHDEVSLSRVIKIIYQIDEDSFSEENNTIVIPKSFGKRVSKRNSYIGSTKEFKEKVFNLNSNLNKNPIEKNKQKIICKTKFEQSNNMSISKWTCENQNQFKTPSVKNPPNSENIQLSKYFTLNTKFFNFNN